MSLRHSLLLGAACSVLLLILPATSEARPKYRAVFEKQYPEYLKTGKKVSCALCHPTEKKTDRNHYGEALAKELKEKNVGDDKVVAEALKKLEEQKCETGKWDERLKKVLPPCECKPKTDSVIERLLGTK